MSEGIWVDAYANNNLPKKEDADIFQDIDTPPCEEFNCPDINRCEAQKLACVAFTRYVAKGSASYDQNTPSLMTEPTNKLFMRLFPES